MLTTKQVRPQRRVLGGESAVEGDRITPLESHWHPLEQVGCFPGVFSDGCHSSTQLLLYYYYDDDVMWWCALRVSQNLLPVDKKLPSPAVASQLQSVTAAKPSSSCHIVRPYFPTDKAKLVHVVWYLITVTHTEPFNSPFARAPSSNDNNNNNNKQIFSVDILISGLRFRGTDLRFVASFCNLTLETWLGWYLPSFRSGFIACLRNPWKCFNLE